MILLHTFNHGLPKVILEILSYEIWDVLQIQLFLGVLKWVTTFHINRKRFVYTFSTQHWNTAATKPLAVSFVLGRPFSFYETHFTKQIGALLTSHHRKQYFCDGN